MRKLILLILIVLGFISCGTADRTEVNKTLTVVNNSSYTVEIVSYIPPNTTEEYESRLIFPPGFIYTRKFKGRAGNSDFFSFSSYLVNYEFSVEKVDIIFNNVRKITYSACTFGNCFEPRNIFNPADDGLENEIYTITNADYDEATDCGGNCN